MKIVIDAFGGDNAPLAVIKGAADAVSDYGVDIILAGDEGKINQCAKENGIDISGFRIIDTPEVFDMHEKPTDILRSGKNTSLSLALKALADGEADAFVSAGSTGAIAAGATFIVKRIKGVKRPAIGSLMPGRERYFMMMDIGANAECRPEMLEQFGIMASVYMKNVCGVENPDIKLLNIGTEDTKGDTLRLEAYGRLKNAPINFTGNIEARDVPAGICDAVITDGFTGNVALKMYEGVSLNLMKIIKEKLKASFISKIGALLAKKQLYSLKKLMDYGEIGGAVLLGVKKPVIKAHGSSDAAAIKGAIRQAKLCVENDIIGKMSADIAITAADDDAE